MQGSLMQTVYLDGKVIRKLLENHIADEKIEIVSFPDARLARVAKQVADVNDAVQGQALSMLQLHYSTTDCAALAATQLSFAEPPAITVIDYSEKRDKPLVLINPQIYEEDGEQFEFEGCMSVFPGDLGSKVKRAQQIKVRAIDFFGKPLDFSAEGFFAKCIQHEVDHLHGKLYLDRLSSMKRRRLLDKLKNLKRG
jgi:peptide deformylase